MPDLNPHSPDDRSTAGPDANGRLRIQDLGDEVYLSFEKRLPWRLALKILEALKAEVPRDRQEVDRPEPREKPEEP